MLCNYGRTALHWQMHRFVTAPNDSCPFWENIESHDGQLCSSEMRNKITKPPSFLFNVEVYM